MERLHILWMSTLKLRSILHLCAYNDAQSQLWSFTRQKTNSWTARLIFYECEACNTAKALLLHVREGSCSCDCDADEILIVASVNRERTDVCFHGRAFVLNL